ncbi:hypothetical protein PCL_07302 [Purpureocillium lilacinum]|uniref:Uncharacterized protein n=1 Tax=Purpureocillium lilacinum TaxID=33203 RepID=A0A2U3DSN3_PURLI|nr:hypothetical protein PCL_07302 [Purpureocillium lilacinum]
MVQLVATASKNPDIIHENVAEMETQMLRALQLSGELWFMAFRLVLSTLAQLPGDAARLVSSEDWKQIGASLGAGRTQEQVQEVFYPGRPCKPVSVASERNPRLLRAFDDRGYRDIHERVLRTSALRFPNNHRITGMSKGNGHVLFQGRDHVVSWLNPKRTVNPRTNTKPLRLDLEQELDYYSPTRLRHAEKRVKIFHPSATPQLPREIASVLLQQEVLDDLYAACFREDTWAGVLKIVRWHVGSDFQLEWLPAEGGNDKPPEAALSTQAANVADAFCNCAAGLVAVREDKRLHSKLQSSAFRTALLPLLLRQCDEAPDGEEMQSDDGARGSRGSHANDDGSTVAVAAAAAAKSPGVDRPVVDPKPAARPPRKKLRNRPRSQTRPETPQCLKLTGLGAWPRGGRRTGMVDGKHSPTRRRGTARRRPEGKSKVNSRHRVRCEKGSGKDSRPNATASSRPWPASWLDRAFTGVDKPVQ